MLFNKLKMVCAAIVLMGAAGSGLGMLVLREAVKPAPLASTVPGEKPATPEKPADRYGDPLPEGAVMRLGTIQRRAVGAQIAVSADGKSIVGVRGGKYVSIWDAETGKLRAKRELPTRFRGLAALSPHGRWLVTDGERAGTLAVWDVQTGKVVRTLTVKGVHQFSPVVFSSDGKRMAAVGHLRDERLLRVWDVESGREIWQKHFDTNLVCGQLTLTADGKQLLVSIDGTSCWNLANGRRQWENKKFSPSTDSMVVTPDGKILSTELRTPMLDLATGQPLSGSKLPPLDDGNVSCLTLSADGRTLLLSTAKGAIVWDTVKGEEVRTLSEAGEIAVFLPDGKSIITNNGSLQRWELATGEPRWPDTFAQGHVSEVLHVAFSADGRHLLSGSADGSLRLWDATTGRQQRLWQGHQAWRPASHRPPSWDGAKLVDVTPDGRWILSAGSHEDIKLWEVSQEKEVRSLRLPASAKNEIGWDILRLRISPDDARAIALFVPTYLVQTLGQPSRLPTHKLASWDRKTGVLLTCHAVELKDARSSTIAPDGRTLLVDGRLMDVASGREIARLEDPVLTRSVGPPPSAPYAFSADGALVITTFNEFDPKKRTSHAGSRLWEAATGKKIADIAVRTIGEMAFHPDNRLVVTNDRQGIRLWDVSTNKMLAARKMPEQVWSGDSWYCYARCFALSPDGRRLATGMLDGTILLWDVPLPPRKNELLTAKELEALWADLAGADAAKAWRAVRHLADASKDTLPFLLPRVKPSATAPADVMRKLLADLDEDSFERREAAGKRLKQLGLPAEPALRAVLEAKPSLEQKKRIEMILLALPQTPPPPSAEELRQLRAVIVLERIGSRKARRVLEEVAKGPPSARLTRQARAALACRR